MSPSEEHRPTLRDVAAKAKVSLMTVSYTFNSPARVADATREKVHAAAEELGYQGKNPWAAALRTGRSGALGVVFSEHLTYAFADPQASEFLAGVASVCAEEGLGLSFIPTVGDSEDAERVRAAPVDGYVFWTTGPDDPCLDAAASTHRPCAIQGGPDHEGFTRISIPDRDAAAAIARTGLAGVVTHPVVLSFSLDSTRSPRDGYGIPVQDAEFPVTRERLAGFQDAITEAGHLWEDTYVVATARNRRQEAQDAVDLLLRNATPVDVVLCTSDELAHGALAALQAHHRTVPGEVVVTGWDDGGEAAGAGLTTVKQSLYEQGRTCGLIAAGHTVAHALQDWEIVERSTTRNGQ